MKHLGTLMRRDPDAEERESLAHVLEIAQAWERGELPLSGVRSACSGRDRYQAMRFAALGSDDKMLLMRLIDALVAEDPTATVTKHGIMGLEEVHAAGVKKVRNWRGERVIVWPMFFKGGDPVYPRVDLEPGEERRRHEEAAMAAYKAYRDEKRRREGR